MSRKIKPVVTVNFKQEQLKILNNIFVVDDFIPVDFCEEYRNTVLNISDTRFSPGIRYGNSNWPISEWGYTINNDGVWHKKNQMLEESKEIWEEVKYQLEEKFDVKPILNDMHLNASSFGQETRIHQDSLNPFESGSHIFVIIFFNDDMDVYDGGDFQTYINLEPDYQKNKDFHKSQVYQSVSPIIGRAVIADTRMLHRGLAPTRFYSGIRLSMAIKISFDDVKESFKKIGFHYV